MLLEGLALLLLLVAGSRGQVKCPKRNCSFGLPECAPRRCCGNPQLPVLGGVDMVDLYRCNMRSFSQCAPRLGDERHAHAPFGGPYRFLFRNESNRALFASRPELFVPQAGGFCAFSMTGFDPNGVGLWCSCALKKQGYAFIDGKSYFFLYSLAKESFLKHGARSVSGMEANFAQLLEENDADARHCFNTERIVPLSDSLDDDCHMMSCTRFLNCSDCD